MKTVTFNIELPVAEDAFGRWLEANNATIELSVMLGRWRVCVSWSRLHSYDDERGTHRESWAVTRYDRDRSKALGDAITQAMKATGT